MSLTCKSSSFPTPGIREQKRNHNPNGTLACFSAIPLCYCWCWLEQLSYHLSTSILFQDFVLIVTRVKTLFRICSWWKMESTILDHLCASLQGMTLPFEFKSHCNTFARTTHFASLLFTKLINVACGTSETSSRFP